MKYPVLIFDLDGTLADTAPDLIATLNRISAPYELAPVALEDVGHIVGHGAKAMLERLFDINGRKIDDHTMSTLFQAFLDDYSANLLTHTTLFDGLEALLPKLIEEGRTLCVCTNKREDMARKLLEDMGQMKHFSSLTGGDTFDFRKPDGRHLEETVGLAQFTIDKAIMIGDSITDIRAAKNANIPSIAVTFGYSDVPVDTLGATKIISSFHDLEDAIREIEAS